MESILGGMRPQNSLVSTSNYIIFDLLIRIDNKVFFFKVFSVLNKRSFQILGTPKRIFKCRRRTSIANFLQI